MSVEEDREVLLNAIKKFLEDATFTPPWESAGAKWGSMIKELHNKWLSIMKIVHPEECKDN